MRTRALSMCFALLGVVAWAEVPTVFIYGSTCDKNNRTIDLRSTVGIENGYTWVNLGLPSGTKWATVNVGASIPEEYGNYYAWGETTTKSSYSWSTYEYANGTNYDDPKLTKYCTKAQYGNNGYIDTLTILDATDDVAHIKWGGNWRMPTDAEWRELRDSCDWTWTTQNGVDGYMVTSRTNGHSIFFPAAGYRNDTGLNDAGSNGRYWSSSLRQYYPNNALNQNFYSNYVSESYNDRSYGYSVRPVYR